MPILNSTLGYGALTKLFHWLIVVLFAFQYLTATIMLRTPAGATTLGMDQATYYNWHKSLGLVALAVAVARLLNRRTGKLPPWAPTLTARERHAALVAAWDPPGPRAGPSLWIERPAHPPHASCQVVAYQERIVALA